MTIQAHVFVSIPVGLEYDDDVQPSDDQLRADALANFLAHPCISDPEYHTTAMQYVDKITFDRICDACKGKGWLLADNSDYGLRIERCDSCGRFKSDDAAVQHVAQLAGDTN